MLTVIEVKAAVTSYEKGTEKLLSLCEKPSEHVRERKEKHGGTTSK